MEMSSEIKYLHRMIILTFNDLNMKTKLSFLRLLVIREIPHLVGVHDTLILLSEEFELKESSFSD